MATIRPNAVVISASAMPADTEASDPPPPDAAIPVNAFTIPMTVPSRPTNGAVAPLFLQQARERRSKRPRLPLRPEDLHQLVDGGRPREHRHERQDEDNELGEQPHGREQIVERRHVRRLLCQPAM